MFGCAAYSGQEDFLNIITQEVKSNVIRLNNHPSIVVWSGSNENEKALHDGWFKNPLKAIQYSDYNSLYISTVFKTMTKFNGYNTDWIDSSPSNGLYSKNPYIKIWGDPSSNDAGDNHF